MIDRSFGSNIDFGFFVMLIVCFGVIVAVAKKVVTKDDPWLVSLIIGGFMAKLVGAYLRWYVLIVVYRGSGDAIGYHSRGQLYADVIRSFQVPEIQNFGSGTKFMYLLSGISYVPYKPSLFGSFVLFGSFAFLGQILFYVAFRNSFAKIRWRWYAIAIFFLPSIIFWPASIGKESVMYISIGIAAWGVSKLLQDYRIIWVIPIAFGLGLTGGVRIHMAALVAGALAVTVMWAKTPKIRGAGSRRLAMVVVGLAGMGLLVSLTAANFDIVLSTEELDVDPFLQTLESTTSTGGSQVEGEPIRSPADVPEGTLRVLFRPLPNEADNAQALAASLESAVLLLLTILRAPAMVREFIHSRRRPYFAYAVVYTAGFVVAFSTFLNLGLLARQRSQVLPFLLILLIAPGGDAAEERIRKRKERRAEQLAILRPQDSEAASDEPARLPVG
ncbi:MAG: hypothetical protein HKN07_05335 [Acidimicrobiia bacterium]|nr:hypothetical protein [Acidimicrobiia bacterium]